MAKELSRNPTVLVVNKELVFAHGGLLPHHVAYGVQRINDEVAAWMKGADCSDGSAPSPPFTAMGDSNSVMWNRTFGKERCSPCKLLPDMAHCSAFVGILLSSLLFVCIFEI